MATVRPIPEGNSTVQAYLVVDDAAKAIDFYKRALGAEEVLRVPGPGGKIAHAELKIGTSRLYLCDEFPQFGNKSPTTCGGSPVSLFLWCEDVDRAFARAVSAGATVKMPVADMFWGDRWGTIVDPFGHTWQMATHKEDVTPEEMARRGQEAMAAMEG
jgi:PhnB protein